MYDFLRDLQSILSATDAP